jgi:hypothetical protein
MATQVVPGPKIKPVRNEAPMTNETATQPTDDDAKERWRQACQAWSSNPWSERIRRSHDAANLPAASPVAVTAAANVQSAPKYSEATRDASGNLSGIRYHETEPHAAPPLALDCEGTRFMATWPPGHFQTEAGCRDLSELLHANMLPQIARLYGDRVQPGQAHWAVGAAYAMFYAADLGLQRGISVALPTSTPLGTAEGIRDSIYAAIVQRVQETTCRTVAAMMAQLPGAK